MKSSISNENYNSKIKFDSCSKYININSLSKKDDKYNNTNDNNNNKNYFDKKKFFSKQNLLNIYQKIIDFRR